MPFGPGGARRGRRATVRPRRRAVSSTTATDRRRRDDPRREDRPADVAEPTRDRGATCVSSSAGTPRCPTTTSAGFASRRSATTTLASRARRTFSSCRSSGCEGRRRRSRATRTGRTTGSGSSWPNGSARMSTGADVVSCEQESAAPARRLGGGRPRARRRRGLLGRRRRNRPSLRRVGEGAALTCLPWLDARARGGRRDRARPHPRSPSRRVLVYGIEGEDVHRGRSPQSRCRRRRRDARLGDPRGGAMHERALMRDVIVARRAARERRARDPCVSRASTCGSVHCRTSLPSTSASTSRTPRTEASPTARSSSRRSRRTSPTCTPLTSSSRAWRSKSDVSRWHRAAHRDLGDGRHAPSVASTTRSSRDARVPSRRKPGAYVLVHLGIPVEVLDTATAEEALALRGESP